MESRTKPRAFDLTDDFFTSYKVVPGPVLGRGMSGEVVLASSPTDPSVQLAVKKLSLLTPDGGIRNKRLFANELGAIQGLNHPHVIKHILSGRCPDYLVICTEYCPNGILTSRLEDLTPSLCILYFLQMACAVRYLNDRQRLVHGDIKPSNIFIDANNNAVLGDFGLSFFILPDDKEVPTQGMGGTPCFSAPEIFTRSHVDPYKLDVYSLGVVLLTMISMREPTSTNSSDCLKDLLFMASIPPPLRLCLASMLQTDPSHRPLISALLFTLHRIGFYRQLIDSL